MIKAKRKPLEEIKDIVQEYEKVLAVGCGGCVSVCLAGGQKEVDELVTEMNFILGNEMATARLKGYTIERQCNQSYLQELDEVVKEYDCVLSMACGAGVQYLAERFVNIPVYPVVNTVAIGIDRGIGAYEERCRACGYCVLGHTGGICPITRCSKQLLNGPCGGTMASGKCEIATSPETEDIPCAWYLIHERLKDQNRLDSIMKIQDIMPWRNKTLPLIVQDKYKERYYKEEGEE